MILKPAIIGNVFCLVDPESGECIAYERDGMRERFARWKLRHKTNDPLAE